MEKGVDAQRKSVSNGKETENSKERERERVRANGWMIREV